MNIEQLQEKRSQLAPTIESATAVKETLYQTILSEVRNFVQNNFSTFDVAISDIEVFVTPVNKGQLLLTLGFYDPKECRIDLGSKIILTYEADNNLELNFNIIGSFSKEHIYQFKRIEVMNFIVTHIHELESYLSQLNGPLQQYTEQSLKVSKLEEDLVTVDKQLYTLSYKDSIEALKEKLTVGTVLLYKENFDRRQRLFVPYGWTQNQPDKWKIIKVNEKTYKIESMVTNELRLIKSGLIIDHIGKGVLQIVNI